MASRLRLSLFILGLALLPATAHAQYTLGSATYKFAPGMDTSSLISAPGNPYYLYFQMNNGGFTFPNNTTLNNFTFGAGGSAVGSPVLVNGGFWNGQSLNGTGSVTLDDSTGTQLMVQEFVPGNQLNFQMVFTKWIDSVTKQPVEDTPSPDEFSFSILYSDPGGFALDTLDDNLDNGSLGYAPNTNVSFITTDDLIFNSVAFMRYKFNDDAKTFSAATPIDSNNDGFTDSTGPFLIGGSPITISAPFVVPEPSAILVWALMGGMAFAFVHYRRRQKPEAVAIPITV